MPAEDPLLPFWVVALLVGAGAGALSALGSEKTDDAFALDPHYPANYGSTTGYDRAAMRADVDRIAKQVLAMKKAAAAFGLLGLFLGIGLGASGGLARGSLRSGLGGAAVGGFSGAAAGAGLSVALVPVYFRLMDPERGLILLFLIYAAIFAGVGAAGGLALGWGLGDRRTIGRCLIGGIFGSFVGTFAFEAINSVAFPLLATFEPVPAEQIPRVVVHFCVAIGAATFAGLAAGSAGTRSTRGMVIIERRRRRLGWLVAIVLVIVAGGMGIWWVTSRAVVGLVSRGMSAYARGDWESALELVRRRLKEAPDDGEALRLAARAMARQDRDQQAIATYSRLDLPLMTPEDYFLLGRASARTGQDESALKCLKAAQAGDPDRPETLNILAEVYFRKDLQAAAEETAMRLARQPAWEARAQLMLGIFRSSLNDPDGALRALRRAFELDPTGKAAAPAAPAPFQKLLVRSLLRTGQPADARVFLRSLSIAETDPEASWLLSRCFLQEKDWKHAALALKRAGPYRRDYPLDPEPAAYVGAAQCASCHPTEYTAVTASRHATTFSFAKEPQSVPLPDRPVQDPGNSRVSHAFQRTQDGIRVESRVGDEVLRALAVYAFGSPDHFVTLVGPDEKGQSRMVRMSYYRSPRGTGWDVSSGLDVHPAHPDEFLGRPLDRRDGERRCLSCHTTNFRAIEHRLGPEAADQSIGCEACHGPGGHHIAAAEAGFSDLAIVVPRKEKSDTINQLCGRCHDLTRAETVTGPDDDPGWLRFQNVTLLRSRCYRESGGKLNCVTCHDPHKSAETSPNRNEAKCLACHSGALGSNHACPVNSSSGCIECHMPKIWVQATHSFKADHNIRIRPSGRDSIHRAAR